jgi:hypothetical protein
MALVRETPGVTEPGVTQAHCGVPGAKAIAAPAPRWVLGQWRNQEKAYRPCR